jgi:SNF2 family DNA or RNA helicase
MAPAKAPSSLRSHVKPFPHQLRAAALNVHAEDTPFKGMILADPPGLGKTLATLMAVWSARKPGDGPVLIVVPPSCARQWMEEIRRVSVEVRAGSDRADDLC